MTFYTTIAGLPVEAVYPDDEVRTLIDPLILHLKHLQAQKKRRILVFLAAPPGAGKSTLCKFLADRGNFAALGMDGFHLPQDILCKTCTVRDGKTIPLVSIKGAPETFDLPKLHSFIKRASSGECFLWPDYDRLLHNPVENRIPVTSDILLIEGNYLLLEREGWKNLKNFADFTIRITADETILRPRLIERKKQSGMELQRAEQFVDFSDMENARLCESCSSEADLMLRLLPDNTYQCIRQRPAL